MIDRPGTYDDPRLEGERLEAETQATRRLPPGDGYGAGGDHRSIGALVREMAQDGNRLVREEIALAKTEMREKVDVWQRNGIAIALGGILLIAAVFAAVTTVNRALTALLTLWVGTGVAVWLAPLLLAVILGLTGWSMVQKGMRKIKDEGVTPQRTVDSLKEDKRWAERKVRS